MKKSDFLNLAIYANEEWKGGYTNKEIFENAETYFSEWQESKKQGKATETIEYLRDTLKQDILYVIVGTPEHKQISRWLKALAF